MGTLSVEVNILTRSIFRNMIISSIIIFTELCSKSFFCTHWQQSFQKMDYDDESKTFQCSLLSSCHYQYIGNTTTGEIVTNTGTRFCLPDPYKRRPCQPACPSSRKFCHGRQSPQHTTYLKSYYL